MVIQVANKQNAFFQNYAGFDEVARNAFSVKPPVIQDIKKSFLGEGLAQQAETENLIKLIDTLEKFTSNVVNNKLFWVTDVL
jgi:hypothetical protein